MVWRILIIKSLGMFKYPLDATLMGLDTIHGPTTKNCGAAPRQISDVQLFRWLPLISDEFRHGTSSIGNFISLSFQWVQKRPNWMAYATWASVLMWTTLGRVGLWIFKLLWQFWSNPTLVGPGTGAIGKVISSSFRSYVERPNLISYVLGTSMKVRWS
jgi:hypothetical protein